MKKYFYGFAVALIMILAFGINEVQASATVYSEDIYYTNSNLSPMWKVDDDSVDALTDHNLTTQNFSRYGTSNIVL